MTEQLDIAVLIPSYNEEVVIDNTISALYAAGFEGKHIYVIDDCSSDNTAKIANELGVNVYSLPKNSGKAKAQIGGIEHFKLCERYNWILFLDGDTKVGTHLKEVLDKTKDEHPDVSLFVGQVMSSDEPHVFSAARAIDYTVGQNFIKKGQDNCNVIFVSPGCASLYSTKILPKLDLDTDVLAEDMDLTIQVHKLGGKVMYVHGAQVYTQDPNNFKDYDKQIKRWYRGFWQVAQKHDMFSFTHKKERVEWYMLYLMFDTMLLNKVNIILLWVLLSGTLTSIATAILIDFAIFFLCALYTFYKTKRVDVLTRSPSAYLISYCNLFRFITSYVEVVLLHKTGFGWNKVKRYEFDHQEAEA